MALRGCFACMRYVVIITNFLLWLLGIGVLAVSVWLYINSKQYLSLLEGSYIYTTAIFILIGAGAVMSVVGFFGCRGALREDQCLLGVYAIFLVVIFGAELTGGVWAYKHKDELQTMVTNYVNSMVRDQYHTDPMAKKTVDIMQHDLHCCGAEGPKDWVFATNEKGEKKGPLDIGAGWVLGVYEVPASCCAVKEDTICQAARQAPTVGSWTSSIYGKGCVERLKEFIDEHLLILICVTIGIAVTQVLALVFSMVLCCGVRDSDGVANV